MCCPMQTTPEFYWLPKGILLSGLTYCIFTLCGEAWPWKLKLDKCFLFSLPRLSSGSPGKAIAEWRVLLPLYPAAL